MTRKKLFSFSTKRKLNTTTIQHQFHVLIILNVTQFRPSETVDVQASEVARLGADPSAEMSCGFRVSPRTRRGGRVLRVVVVATKQVELGVWAVLLPRGVVVRAGGFYRRVELGRRNKLKEEEEEEEEMPTAEEGDEAGAAGGGRPAAQR